MTAEHRKKVIGAILITVSLGIFATAITDWPHGIITAGFVAVALVVAKNL
jgi:hypothetical protein